MTDRRKAERPASGSTPEKEKSNMTPEETAAAQKLIDTPITAENVNDPVIPFFPGATEAPTAQSIAKWCGVYENDERFQFVIKGLDGMLERLRNSQFANLEQRVGEFFVDDFDNGPGTLGPLLFRRNTAFGYDEKSPVGPTVSLALCRDIKEFLRRILGSTGSVTGSGDTQGSASVAYSPVGISAECTESPRETSPDSTSGAVRVSTLPPQPASVGAGAAPEASPSPQEERVKQHMRATAGSSWTETIPTQDSASRPPQPQYTQHARDCGYWTENVCTCSDPTESAPPRLSARPDLVLANELMEIVDADMHKSRVLPTLEKMADRIRTFTLAQGADQQREIADLKRQKQSTHEQCVEAGRRERWAQEREASALHLWQESQAELQQVRRELAEAHAMQDGLSGAVDEYTERAEAAEKALQQIREVYDHCECASLCRKCPYCIAGEGLALPSALEKSK